MNGANAPARSRPDRHDLRAGDSAALAHLAGRLGELSRSWLVGPDPAHSLRVAVGRAVQDWPTTTAPAPTAAGALLYPFVYQGSPRVTPRQFCELTDGAFEAARARTELRIVGLPLGRSARRDNTGALQQMAEAWQRLGLPVDSVGDIDDLPGIGSALTNRARTSAFSRRNVDLVDMFAAAALDASQAGSVYLAEGVVPRRGLASAETIRPMGQLYGPDPYADPPAGAKLRPAGSDALWFLAFTAGILSGVAIEGDRGAVRLKVRQRVGQVWNRLRAAGLVKAGAAPAPPAEVDLRLTGPTPVGPVVVPVFGSPGISPANAAFVAAVAEIAAGSRTTLVVDDVNPMHLYPGRAAAVRPAWTDLATTHGCSVRFLSDLDAGRLSEEIDDALSRLQVNDLMIVAGTGQARRRRGGHTGYDAVHLATMAVAVQVAAGDDVIVAVRAANLPAIRRFERFIALGGVLADNGARPHDRRHDERTKRR